MYISFMEIYNEVAYDLLDRRHIEMSLESWNKVFLSFSNDLIVKGYANGRRLREYSPQKFVSSSML